MSIISEEAVSGMIAPVPSYFVIYYGNTFFVYAFFDLLPLSQEHIWDVKQGLCV